MFEDDYGVQSYFGESGDCDFFGDTSMSGGFASGMGEAGFVSEAFAQDSMGGSFFTEASEYDTMGGEFINEATAFDMDGEVFTELDSSIPNSTSPKSYGRGGWIEDQINKGYKASRAAGEEAYDKARAKGASQGDALGVGLAATEKVWGAHNEILDDEREATGKHVKGIRDTRRKHIDDRRHKSKAKADGARPASTQNSASSGTPIKRTSDDKVVGRSYPAGDKRLGGKSNK